MRSLSFVLVALTTILLSSCTGPSISFTILNRPQTITTGISFASYKSPGPIYRYNVQAKGKGHTPLFNLILFTRTQFLDGAPVEKGELDKYGINEADTNNYLNIHLNDTTDWRSTNLDITTSLEKTLLHTRVSGSFYGQFVNPSTHDTTAITGTFDNIPASYRN